MPTVRINLAVGGGRAKNNPEDVKIIQGLLRQAALDPGERTIDPRRSDGVCDSRTKTAILTFQRRFLKRPDGVVDPGRQTLHNLIKVTQPGVSLRRAGTIYAEDLVKVLLPHQGELYDLGAKVPKTNANWIGPWDCAEFVAWGIYQVSGRYVGCKFTNSPNGVRYMNAYTGWFGQQLPGCATEVEEEEASETPGVIALRLSRGHGQIGHIAVTRGINQTIEAASTRQGVRSKRLKGRTWRSFWKLDFLTYKNNQCSFV